MEQEGHTRVHEGARLERVQAQVRSAARWHGWMWLVIAVATPGFLIGTHLEGEAVRSLSLWIALAFIMLGLALWWAEAQRPVRGRTTARVDQPATRTYIVAMVLFAVFRFAVDPVGTPWWYVAVALVPALPAAWAAVTILRS